MAAPLRTPFSDSARTQTPACPPCLPATGGGAAGAATVASARGEARPNVAHLSLEAPLRRERSAILKGGRPTDRAMEEGERERGAVDSGAFGPVKVNLLHASVS